jgi:hypothetical protein
MQLHVPYHRLVSLENRTEAKFVYTNSRVKSQRKKEMRQGMKKSKYKEVHCQGSQNFTTNTLVP